MSLLNMNGHILCAVDVETTGVLCGYNEIIQIACVPLDQHFEPHKKMKPFYLNMRPEYPERASKEATQKHGISAESLLDCVSQEKGFDLFVEWWNNCELPYGKRMVPLAHNWGFERGFLTYWLGVEGLNTYWQSHPRDTMLLGASINDLYVWHGRKHPFPFLNLVSMCKRLDIQFDNAHDALADCLATAKLYAALMRFFGG